MSVSSLFGQLAQAALPYDRYTAGDELRLDYKSDFLLSLLETVLPLIRSYFRYEGVSLENIRSSGRAMLDYRKTFNRALQTVSDVQNIVGLRNRPLKKVVPRDAKTTPPS